MPPVRALFPSLLSPLTVKLYYIPCPMGHNPDNQLHNDICHLPPLVASSTCSHSYPLKGSISANPATPSLTPFGDNFSTCKWTKTICYHDCAHDIIMAILQGTTPFMSPKRPYHSKHKNIIKEPTDLVPEDSPVICPANIVIAHPTGLPPTAIQLAQPLPNCGDQPYHFHPAARSRSDVAISSFQHKPSNIQKAHETSI
jgi:hypothetical protein